MSEQIRQVAEEIERGCAKVGWDQPPSLYALVRTADLLGEPNLPADVAASVREAWDGSPEHLSAVLQDRLPEDEIEEVLPRLAWPEQVVGAALSVERIIAPPEVEAQAPTDPEEAAAFIASHPDHTDVRITVAALRDGDTWSMIRTRAFDSDQAVGSGPALVPALSDLLLASLAAE